MPAGGELVGRIENQSKREAAKILADLAPVPMVEDRVRPVGGEYTEIRFVASARLVEKLEKIKALRSHMNANPSMAELLEDLADLALKKLDRAEARLRPGEVASPGQSSPKPSTRKPSAQESPTETAHPAARKAIPVALKREVWRRDQGRCVYRDPKTGRQCESRHLIQIDHRVPKALGGADALENLSLHCFSHHQLAAARVFGEAKMAPLAQRRA